MIYKINEQVHGANLLQWYETVQIEWLRINLCMLSQVQYVFTETVLDPQTVCEQFHLCNQILPSGKLEEKHNENQRQIGVINKTNVSEGDGTSLKFFDTTSMNDNKHEHSQVHPQSRKHQSGQITFVHISDIHLDLEYNEVRTKTTLNMKLLF